MKRHYSIIAFIIVTTGAMMAQSGQGLTEQVPGMETFLVITDRGDYISGEHVFFRAYNLGQSVSKILYVELVNPDGSSLVKTKIPMGNSGGQGRIVIPQSISSGTYYLKTYSRWMRNYAPEAFSYTSIQVYDPFMETILSVDSSATDIAAREFDFSGDYSHPEEMLEYKLTKSSFGIREQVELDLVWKFGFAPVNLSVAVIPSFLHGHQHHFTSLCKPGSKQRERFLPETKGLSLTGKAIFRDGGSPASYATIYLSVLGREPEFFSNYSDVDGRFYFSFPAYKGSRDLFVSTYHSGEEELELLIDRDFETRSALLPSYPLQIADSLKKVITALSVNAQVAQQYFTFPTSVSDDSIVDQRLFYGHPSVTVLFDDFIKLPTMEEYFAEVIPQVTLKKNRKTSYFVVIGSHPDLNIYQPLVMIDGVAIFDVDAVLNVSPRLIDRVEIITAPYVLGSVTFGGIVSLITRNGDMGYIDLPSSGLLVSYQMLEESLSDPVIGAEQELRVPDVRNTLYWDPEIIIAPEGSHHIEFMTSDGKGSYDIHIRGVDEMGRTITRIIPIIVK